MNSAIVISLALIVMASGCRTISPEIRFNFLTELSNYTVANNIATLNLAINITNSDTSSQIQDARFSFSHYISGAKLPKGSHENILDVSAWNGRIFFVKYEFANTWAKHKISASMRYKDSSYHDYIFVITGGVGDLYIVGPVEFHSVYGVF